MASVNLDDLTVEQLQAARKTALEKNDGPPQDLNEWPVECHR